MKEFFVTKARSGFVLLFCLLLVACGEPASKDQIQNFHANKTIYTPDGKFRAYFSPAGRYYEINGIKGMSEKGNWFARAGEICGKPDGKPLECRPAYFDGNAVTVGLGGYKVASGDRFGLQRRFGEGQSTRRTSSRNGVNLKQVLTGVVGAIAETCRNGACSGSASSPAPAQSSSNGQCRASKQQCYASCEGLSRENKHALVVSSPYANCRKQCTRISC